MKQKTLLMTVTIFTIILSSVAQKKTPPIGSKAYNNLAKTTIQDTASLAQVSTSCATVTDADGNVYTTVKIGNQVWTVENLRTTKYNDGTAIPLVKYSGAWGALKTPGYCYYDNTTNADSIRKFGALYNWYAVGTNRLAPKGWHVPTDGEWRIMENYLVEHGYNYDRTTESNKIAKALAANTDWRSYSTEGTIGYDLTLNNRSGFSALPGGSRDSIGTFIPSFGQWWSASDYYVYGAGDHYLYSITDDLGSNFDNYRCGFSVRLVKDQTASTTEPETNNIKIEDKTIVVKGTLFSSDKWAENLEAYYGKNPHKEKFKVAIGLKWVTITKGYNEKKYKVISSNTYPRRFVILVDVGIYSANTITITASDNGYSYIISMDDVDGFYTEATMKEIDIIEEKNNVKIEDDGGAVNSENGWIPLASGVKEDLRSAFFTDNNTGYAVGFQGIIIKTTNAGTTWTNQKNGTNKYLHQLNSIFFTDSNTGYAVGYSGTIIKTVNGGDVWTPQVSGLSDDVLQQVIFTSYNTGYIICQSSGVLKTTNGGENWRKLTIEKTGGLYSAFFIDDNTGYVVGQNGSIRKTTDGGTTWSKQISGCNDYLVSVYFTDVNTGYVVCQENGTILKTKDGGITWIAQKVSSATHLINVFFKDNNLGYIVASGGTILFTTDGGNTWIRQTCGTTKTLRSVCVTSDNTSYILGDAGTILKKTEKSAQITGNAAKGDVPKWPFTKVPPPAQPETKSIKIEIGGTESTPVTDADGNVYRTLKIGDQVWTMENLRTSKLNDGTPIPMVKGNNDWKKSYKPEYCYYKNSSNINEIKKNGALYNCYAVASGKLAPKGWHVAKVEDWDTLINYLATNGYSFDGQKVGYIIAKALSANSDWDKADDKNAVGNDLSKNNKSGFNALPCGMRVEDGKFQCSGTVARWWFASYEINYLNENSLSYYGIGNSDEGAGRINDMKSALYGFSVRLVRD